MNLLFVDITPPKDLEQILLSSGLTTFNAKASSLPKEGNFDIIVYSPRSLASLKERDVFAHLQPTPWIVLIMKDEWLKDSESLNECLKQECSEYLLTSHWEKMILFSLKNYSRRQGAKIELESLVQESQSLKSHVQELSITSQQLIEQLERDVQLASNIQRWLLPKYSPEIPGIHVSVKYLPSQGVGGDYYDIFEFGDRRRLGILLADSKSHGMAASLLSVLVKVRLEEMKDRFPDSKAFVEYLNSEIAQFHEREMSSLSLLYGILDRHTLQFKYTVAGHLKPLLLRMGEPTQLPIVGNPPLGGVDRFQFRENIVSLKPGDHLFFHTDGLNTPFSGKDGSGETQILDLLRQKYALDSIDLQNEVLAFIDHYVDKKPLLDDVTFIQLVIDEKALYMAPKIVADIP